MMRGLPRSLGRKAASRTYPRDFGDPSTSLGPNVEKYKPLFGAAFFIPKTTKLPTENIVNAPSNSVQKPFILAL